MLPQPENYVSIDIHKYDYVRVIQHLAVASSHDVISDLAPSDRRKGTCEPVFAMKNTHQHIQTLSETPYIGKYIQCGEM